MSVTLQRPDAVDVHFNSELKLAVGEAKNEKLIQLIHELPEFKSNLSTFRTMLLQVEKNKESEQEMAKQTNKVEIANVNDLLC